MADARFLPECSAESHEMYLNTVLGDGRGKRFPTVFCAPRVKGDPTQTASSALQDRARARPRGFLKSPSRRM